MRRNMTGGERMLSIIGGLAFTGLGMSERLRNSTMGKTMTVLGAKTTVVGIIGYDPLLDLLDN
ncbi:DUF2892 domain-containing protein [Desulfofalx alkaliphila]|uniref:DUF2892 domain-containing protein n=1 Tax=Desulfofalx alkaliphila TaxID=105483 RepID=UPI0004E0C131|nr:DUF2892 domain-containing protein [Desulfofalx alkaliphila]